MIRWRLSRCPWARATAAALVACAGLALPAAAEDAASSGRQRFTRGAMQVALLGGYGHGFRFGSQEDRDKSAELGDVRIWEAIPRFGISATDPLFGGLLAARKRGVPLRGRLPLEHRAYALGPRLSQAEGV